MSDLHDLNNFTMLKMFNLEEKNIDTFKVYDIPELNNEGKIVQKILTLILRI